ncbi:MAG: hypothetical protein JOY71_04120 [Acetobacteraceae bacterium]|nr:hypothetical protein [Acetobacteraceae bacterium]MBV8589867.1 hypothetical protein [Acetobacteraceae bacterium]
MRVDRFVVVVIGTTFIGACSPYPYSPAVKSFADNTNSVSDDLTKTDVAATNAMAMQAAEKRHYEGPRPAMTLAPACYLPESKGGRCEQIERAPPESNRKQVDLNERIQSTVALAPPAERFQCPPLLVTKTQSQPAGTPSVETGKVITLASIEKTLKDYAKALAAITNAADRAALDAAFSDLSKSVTTMAATVGMAGGPAVSAAAGAIAGPAVSLVGRIVGTAEDERRLEALDATLRITCLPMQTLSSTVDGLLQIRLNEIAASRIRTINSLNYGRAPGMSPEEYYRRDIRINEIIAQGIRLPEGNPGLKMGEAHDALVKAVVNREGQTAELLKALANFASSVSDLESAINKAPAKPPTS